MLFRNLSESTVEHRWQKIINPARYGKFRHTWFSAHLKPYTIAIQVGKVNSSSFTFVIIQLHWSALFCYPVEQSIAHCRLSVNHFVIDIIHSHSDMNSIQFQRLSGLSPWTWTSHNCLEELHLVSPEDVDKSFSEGLTTIFPLNHFYFWLLQLIRGGHLAWSPWPGHGPNASKI